MEYLECPDALWVITESLQGGRSDWYIMRRTWLLALKTEGENHKPETQTELEAGQGTEPPSLSPPERDNPSVAFMLVQQKCAGLLKEAQVSPFGLS